MRRCYKTRHFHEERPPPLIAHSTYCQIIAKSWRWGCGLGFLARRPSLALSTACFFTFKPDHLYTVLPQLR